MGILLNLGGLLIISRSFVSIDCRLASEQDKNCANSLSWLR